jgi:hypothetical protein
MTQNEMLIKCINKMDKPRIEVPITKIFSHTTPYILQDKKETKKTGRRN